MVALLAVEVASVPRVTCPVLGREFASSFFWIQQLGHRSMRGTLNVFCLFWWPTSCYLLSGHGCTDWTQFMLKSPQAGQNFLKIGGGFMECFQKTRVINRWRDGFFPGNFNWFLFGFFLMSHRLSFACQMGDMLHALICRTDHDDSWKKAWGLFSRDMNMYKTYRCQRYLRLGTVRSYLLQYLHISCFEVFQTTVWNLYIKGIFAYCPLKLMHFPDIFCFEDSSDLFLY